MRNWLRDVAIFLNHHQREGLLRSGVSMRQIGTMPARERQRERRCRMILIFCGSQLKACRDCISLSVDTCTKYIQEMQVTLLPQPHSPLVWGCDCAELRYFCLWKRSSLEPGFCGRMWRKERLLGIWHLETFFDGYPRSFPLLCYILATLDVFHQWCGRFLPWPQGMELLKSFHQRQLLADVFWRLTWAKLCGGWPVMSYPSTSGLSCFSM